MHGSCTWPISGNLLTSHEHLQIILNRKFRELGCQLTEVVLLDMPFHLLGMFLKSFFLFTFKRNDLKHFCFCSANTPSMFEVTYS